MFKEVFDQDKVRFCPKFTKIEFGINVRDILDQDILKRYEEQLHFKNKVKGITIDGYKRMKQENIWKDEFILKYLPDFKIKI